MGEYTVPQSKKELFSLFQRDSNKGSFIWVQHPHTEVKQIFPIKDIKLHMDDETLEIHLEKEFENHNLPYIFIYHPFRKTISKTKLVAHEDDIIVVDVPRKIKTMCMRARKRFRFKPMDEKFVLVQVESPLMKSATQELRLLLIDISQSGMAVALSQANKEFVNSSEILRLTQIGSVSLPKPVDIKVVYIAPFKYRLAGKQVRSNRAGFKFDKELPKFLVEGIAK